jgi:hypothetical protein
MESRNHVPFAFVWAKDLDIACGEPSNAKTIGHRFGCHCRAANGIGRIDFDELLENVVRELSRRAINLRTKRADNREAQQNSRHNRSMNLHAKLLGWKPESLSNM